LTVASHPTFFDQQPAICAEQKKKEKKGTKEKYDVVTTPPK
jgi:hypothetical protein